MDCMDYKQLDVEKWITRVFERYKQAKGVLTTAFPKSGYVKAILKELSEDLTDKKHDEIIEALRRDFHDYLQKWIVQEFDNSAGTLVLSIEELQDYFQLDTTLTKIITDNLLQTEQFVLQEDIDLSMGKKIERLQIHPKYSHNYWLMSVLVEKEAEVLVELGSLLKKPLNSNMRNLVIEKQHVVELNLSKQSLTSLPNTIGNLLYLEKLFLQDNKLSSLPTTIGNLIKLKVLDLDYNQLPSLPESLGNLTDLQLLCCRKNKLRTLPKTLGDLKSLQRLSLEYNQLRSLPETLGNLTNLQKLWCPHNHLKSLPESLGNLQSLQRFSLEFNKLKSLPETLGNLQNLEILLMNNNQLISLPSSLKELVSLKFFSVYANLQLDSESRELLQGQELIDIRTEFRPPHPQDYPLAREEYLLKICLVGHPSELKTKLIRSFVEGKWTQNRFPTPTLGVDITTKQIKVDDSNVKLILVDTAGQEFFGKLRPSYYRGASAAIITFNKGDRETFNAIRGWYKEFRRHIPSSSVPIALVGIITESEEVTTDEGQNLAKEHRSSYYETDVTDIETITTVVKELTLKVIRRNSFEKTA